VLLIALPLTAALVVMCNLPAIIGEIRHVRIARPDRVEQEDAEARAAASPPREVQISPWDYETRQA
jgi:hypothetical protein